MVWKFATSAVGFKSEYFSFKYTTENTAQALLWAAVLFSTKNSQHLGISEEHFVITFFHLSIFVVGFCTINSFFLSFFWFLRQGLVLLPRLGAIMTHCSPDWWLGLKQSSCLIFPSIWDYRCVLPCQLLFKLLVEMRSYYVAQANHFWYYSVLL